MLKSALPQYNEVILKLRVVWLLATGFLLLAEPGTSSQQPEANIKSVVRCRQRATDNGQPTTDIER